MSFSGLLGNLQQAYGSGLLSPDLTTDPQWQTLGNMSNPSIQNMNLMDLLRQTQAQTYANTQNLPSAPDYMNLVAARGPQPDNFAPPAAVTPNTTQANNPVMVPNIQSYPGAPAPAAPGGAQNQFTDLEMLIKSGLLTPAPKLYGKERTSDIYGNPLGFPGYWTAQQNADYRQSTRDG